MNRRNLIDVAPFVGMAMVVVHSLTSGGEVQHFFVFKLLEIAVAFVVAAWLIIKTLPETPISGFHPFRMLAASAAIVGLTSATGKVLGLLAAIPIALLDLSTKIDEFPMIALMVISTIISALIGWGVSFAFCERFSQSKMGHALALAVLVLLVDKAYALVFLSDSANVPDWIGWTSYVAEFVGPLTGGIMAVRKETDGK